MVSLYSEKLCDRCGNPIRIGHVCVATINMDHLNALLDLYNYAEEMHIPKCKQVPDLCRACIAIKKIRSFA